MRSMFFSGRKSTALLAENWQSGERTRRGVGSRPVSLHALEKPCTIVQHGTGRIQAERSVWLNLWRCPPGGRVIRYDQHVVRLQMLEVNWLTTPGLTKCAPHVKLSSLGSSVGVAVRSIVILLASRPATCFFSTCASRSVGPSWTVVIAVGDIVRLAVDDQVEAWSSRRLDFMAGPCDRDPGRPRTTDHMSWHPAL